MFHSKNVIAIPPGETIREQLERRGMKQKEFAIRMEMSEKHISHLINGKVELTQDVALRLEYVLGVPAGFWNNLEALYREQLSRVESELEMEEDAQIASKFPYAKMVKLKWIKAVRKKEEKAEALREFFEVAKLSVLPKLTIPGIVYRVNGKNATSNYSLAVWAQKARLESRKYAVSDINIKKLRQNIPQLRNLNNFKPKIFCDKARAILADCGVVVVYLPHIDGSFLHGATFIDGNRIVMGLTVRGKNADIFWFSFFHELYHILAGHIYNNRVATDAEETEADEFAKNTLINPRNYGIFIEKNNYSRDAIIAFSKKEEIAAGIVVGRLQKEGFIKYNMYNALKEQYKI